MKYKGIKEEELKNKVGSDWFKDFDTSEIIGNIDFTVLPVQNSLFNNRTPLLWAEAKTGDYDIATMFVQLILTIGRARTFDKVIPPAYLGAFDYKKMVFVPYINIQDIFHINDFNWNVTPSNHQTKEFELIKERIKNILQIHKYIFDYENDAEKLSNFIKNSIANATVKNKIKINKNNFIPIYLRWIEHIKPIIDVDWEELKSLNILDSDFYLADLFVDDKNTLNIDDDRTTREGLFVTFCNQGYKIAKENLKQAFDATVNIKNKELYQEFWRSYKRPPRKDYEQYIIERRDLLAPQDIRERKGAFFTPRPWVELSQKYLCDALGDNWQDEYYIWDCAAGTGNLLAGLTNKYNIYASTLDQADVNVMYERIDNGANLLKAHAFQFDFLNDDFAKLPQALQNIINDEEKRKKLIIYINPPYAESANMKTVKGTGVNKSDVAITTKTYNKYSSEIGIGGRELFVQFLTRIYLEIPNAILAEFSKLKILQAPNFSAFRNIFHAKLERLFVVPADTFDNVKGKFPIGFFIWNTGIKEHFTSVICDIYNSKGNFIGNKTIYNSSNSKSINDWLITTRNRVGEKKIGFLSAKGNDFQNTNFIFIINDKEQLPHPRGTWITDKNLKEIAIYLCVRHIIPATWLNDRDQFLCPNNDWMTDKEFQSDCLVYTLFNNNISIRYGKNHWIPFTENEVNAVEKFDSNFMVDFINGEPIEFSEDAKAVLDAGRDLWIYYHSQDGVDVNGSLYDIKEHFQGRNDKGKMNNRSSDEVYNKKIELLRNTLNILAKKITPKVYEYGFLNE